MNVKGGCGIHYPTSQGSPAFLNRSIYHARKSLTRLNIPISDICWTHFVQISASHSVLGVYRLWKFENLGRFLTARQPVAPLSGFSSTGAPKIPAYPPRFFPTRAKTARIAYIYNSNNAPRSSRTPNAFGGEGPPEGRVDLANHLG